MQHHRKVFVRSHFSAVRTQHRAQIEWTMVYLISQELNFSLSGFRVELHTEIFKHNISLSRPTTFHCYTDSPHRLCCSAAHEHICGQSCSAEGTPCAGAHHTLKMIPVWYFLTQLLFSCHLGTNIWQYRIENKVKFKGAWHKTAPWVWGCRCCRKWHKTAGHSTNPS